MPKFIRLTEVGKSSKKPNAVMLVNTACIHSVKKSDSGEDTHIHTGGSNYFFVKESVDEITVLLNSQGRPEGR